jgi:uncharacterized RDD family membrane protein YckC
LSGFYPNYIKIKNKEVTWKKIYIKRLNLMYAVLGIVIFVVINGKFLVQNGQTVGKKILGIKITDLTQQNPTTSALFKRYGLYLGLGQIPFIGAFFSIINVLFIFSKSKRCLHDLAAKTIVIKNA